jgi:hypothetical protein
LLTGIIGTLVTGGDAGKLPDLRDVLSVSFKVRKTQTSPPQPAPCVPSPSNPLLPQFMTKQDKKEGAAAASPHTDQLLSQVLPTFLLSSARLSLHTRSLHQER